MTLDPECLVPPEELAALCERIPFVHGQNATTPQNLTADTLAMARASYEHGCLGEHGLFETTSRWYHNTFGGNHAPRINDYLLHIPLSDTELRARVVQVGQISTRKAPAFAVVALHRKEYRSMCYSRQRCLAEVHRAARTPPRRNPDDFLVPADALDRGELRVRLLTDADVANDDDSMHHYYMCKAYIDGLTFGLAAAGDHATPVYLPPRRKTSDLCYQRTRRDPTGAALVFWGDLPVGYASMWRFQDASELRVDEWQDGNPLSHVTFSSDPGVYEGYISSARIVPLFGADHQELTELLVTGIERMLIAYHDRGILFDRVFVRAHSGMVLRACRRMGAKPASAELHARGNRELVQLRLRPWSVRGGRLAKLRCRTGYRQTGCETADRVGHVCEDRAAADLA